MLYQTEYRSPVGKLTLAGDGEKLTGLWLEGQKYFGGRADSSSGGEGLPVFAQAAKWLDRYFAGGQPDPQELSLAPSGGEFRRLVWRLLLEIPYGQVTTYGELAKKAAARLGRDTMSGQAVGGAVAHNPISIIIPCHRVVGSDGSLTGYAGGLDIKISLLKHEGVDMEKLYRPKRGTAL